MHAYQKEIAKREMLNLVCSYLYKVTPLSDQAKLFFAIFNKNSGPIEKITPSFLEKYLKVDRKPFVGKISFYYDETDEAKVKSLAVWNMAESCVPGINHPNSGKKTTYAPLEEGKDFKVEVGEKIIHEQPKPLTFDDIRDL